MLPLGNDIVIEVSMSLPASHPMWHPTNDGSARAMLHGISK